MEEIGDKATESDSFRELAHYIGRLGAHQHAVSTVISAMLKVPSLQHISKIRLAPPSEVQEVTIHPGSLDPYEIVKRICKKTSDIGSSIYLHAFVEIDYESNMRQEMLQTPSVMTRVHSELLLVDLFSRKRFDFVDDDKYIGCSKAACYFCKSWISMHHKDFVLPASHNKVIVGCRGPDVDPEFDINRNGEKLRKEMCEKMVWRLEQDILDRLRSKDRITHFQHLSSNGSSRAPTVISSNSTAPLRR